MLLDYLYNDFIVNLFVKHSSCTCQEKLPGHTEESNVAKQLVWRIFTSWFMLYICCFFTLNTQKTLSKWGLLWCIQIKHIYTSKINICILKYSTLYTWPNLHCSTYSVNPRPLLPFTHRDDLYLRKSAEHYFH